MRSVPRHRAAPVHSAVRRRLAVLSALLLALVGMAALQPSPAAATHYRANQINWHAGSGPGEVEFHLTGSWRCTFFSDPCTIAVGDTFTSESLDPGDGGFLTATFTATAVDPVNDVVTGESHVVHTYADPSQSYTAQVSGCCRLSSSSGHLNNGDGNIVYETIVNLAATSASPIGLVSPIVDCPLNAVCSFTVPAVDPDGQSMSFRLSTDVEASGSTGGFSQPSGATINAGTGLYQWDTTGAALAASGPTFYSTQVMIENVVGGQVISKTPVDFFIRLGSNSTNQQPVFESPTPADGSVVNATVGVPLSIGLKASDPDSGDTVTLGYLGSLPGANLTQTTGNPATGTLAWTPSAPGDYPVTLTAQDQLGLNAVPRGITIRVAQGTANPPPTVDAGGNVSGAEGSAINVDGTVTDTEPVTTTWSATPGAGVDAGASCTFGNPGAVDTTVTCTDDGTWTLTLSGNDGTNPPVTDTTTLTVSNAAPSVTITSPADTAVLPTANAVAVSANLADAGSNDTHTCSIDWGDGATTTGTVAGGKCTGSHAYASDGVWTITVTATDDDGASGSASIMVVTVSAADKITGGGFVSTSGRTSFGFVAKAVATGGWSGQIQVRAPGGHKFHGSRVTALTVSGTSATWSGTGKWDGKTGYTFTASIQDNRNGGGTKGTADTFAITIKNSSGATVFSTSGPLKGGNVTVHR